MLSIYSEKKVEWFSDYSIFINVFNNIMAPLMIEIFVSPNCLEYMFTSLGATSFPSPLFCEFAVAMSDYSSELNVISYTNCTSLPPIGYTQAFSYNFQCSSSMLQNFAYVFIYPCVYNVILVPVLWMWLKRWQQWSFVRYGTSSPLFKVVTMCIPMLLRLLSHSTSKVTHLEAISIDSVNRMEEERRYFNLSIFVFLINKDAERGAVKLRIRLLTDLSILLSFGSVGGYGNRSRCVDYSVYNEKIVFVG
jgi:hypothetical protein